MDTNEKPKLRLTTPEEITLWSMTYASSHASGIKYSSVAATTADEAVLQLRMRLQKE